MARAAINLIGLSKCRHRGCRSWARNEVESERERKSKRGHHVWKKTSRRFLRYRRLTVEIGLVLHGGLPAISGSLYKKKERSCAIARPRSKKWPPAFIDTRCAVPAMKSV